MLTMTFHESYGEIPSTLFRAMTRYKVTPAEFYAMEYAGMSHVEMEDHILSHIVDGRFTQPLYL